MTDQLVKDNERIDDLQNGYYVIQDPDKFCFGMDAVLLSGFAKVKKGETALDLGTGTGIIPILLKTKTNGKHFTGLEIQKECADMAGRSVRYNHLEDDVEIVRGDIKEAADIFGAASFDVVTSNPPYMIGQHGLRNPDMPKAIARHEVLCNLEDVVSQASKVLKERGRFYMVHRPFRLAEIMNVLTKYRLEPKRMQLVYPYIDREPNMVLIEALKGGNSRVTGEPPLPKHNYQFDRVVSVGMLEHVGRDNYQLFLDCVEKVLKPGGLFLLHFISALKEHPGDPWIKKYIFPGGTVPSLREILNHMAEDNFHTLDIENLRLHYNKTLLHWEKNFRENIEKEKTMFDESFLRMWELYLSACAATFHNGIIDLHQILMTKGINNDLPMTRWY